MGVPQDPPGAGRPESHGRGVNSMGDLKTSGVDPPPLQRTRPTWPQFLRSHAEAILACDFFSLGLPDGTQAHVLAVIEHATRRIPHPRSHGFRHPQCQARLRLRPPRSPLTWDFP